MHNLIYIYISRQRQYISVYRKHSQRKSQYERTEGWRRQREEGKERQRKERPEISNEKRAQLRYVGRAVKEQASQAQNTSIPR
jgi:hypothetical protein